MVSSTYVTATISDFLWFCGKSKLYLQYNRTNFNFQKSLTSIGWRSSPTADAILPTSRIKAVKRSAIMWPLLSANCEKRYRNLSKSFPEQSVDIAVFRVRTCKEKKKKKQKQKQQEKKKIAMHLENRSQELGSSSIVQALQKFLCSLTSFFQFN